MFFALIEIGVSGFSFPYLFGTISMGSKEYEITYRWGTGNIERFFEVAMKRWQFYQVPCQNSIDTNFYAKP